MRRYMIRAVLCVVVICASVLAGCSIARVDLASEPTFMSNAKVDLSKLEIYVQPEGEAEHPPTALFMPFRITQQMDDAGTVGRNLSYFIWQVWLQEKAFPVLEFAQTSTPYRPDVALSMAARKGADMVVGGYITHLVDGGTTGDTTVSIAVEIYDVRTGMLMWSMAQGAMMTQAQMRDYLLFAVKSRLPGNPLGAAVSAIAANMAKRVNVWAGSSGNQFPPPEEAWYKLEPGAFK